MMRVSGCLKTTVYRTQEGELTTLSSRHHAALGLNLPPNIFSKSLHPLRAPLLAPPHTLARSES